MSPRKLVEQVEYLPHQQEAIRHVLYDDSIRAILYYGGVRSGKSFTACKLAQIVSQKFPRSKALIARDTRVNLKSTTLQTFFGYDGRNNPVIMPYLYNPKDYNKSEGTLLWQNGSQTCFWGLDDLASIERVKSTEWSFTILEEATGINMDIIQFILETRLSHPVGPHKMLLTTNTDRGQEEIYELFFKHHTCDPMKHCETCGGPCTFRRVYSSTLDNKDNLPEKYIRNIEQLAASDPRYYNVYVKGEWSGATGLIFPEYNPNVHIIDLPENIEWPPGTDTVHSYDHGFGSGASCMEEVKILPDGSHVYWNEYYEVGKTVKTMASEIMEQYGVTYIDFADPAIRQRTQTNNHTNELCSVQDLFEEYGITMETANNDVDGGIEIVKSMLEVDPEHEHPFRSGFMGAPYIFLARVNGQLRCSNIDRQIRKYRQKEQARAGTGNGKWNPVKADDHAIDNVRYVSNGRPPIPSVTEQEPKQGTAKWAMRIMLEKQREREGKGMRAISGAL